MTLQQRISVYDRRYYSFWKRWVLTVLMIGFYARCRLGWHNPLGGIYSRRVWCWTCGRPIIDVDGNQVSRRRR